MNLPVKIFVYLILSGLGLFSAAAILMLSMQFGFIESLPPDDRLEDFRMAYMGGGMIVSIAGVVLGLISFFTSGKLSGFFLALPLALPVLYSIGVLMLFPA